MDKDGKQRIIRMKCRTPNGRFGVMAAIYPLKQQCKFEPLYPAATAVEAATTPSRWDVARKRADCANGSIT